VMRRPVRAALVLIAAAWVVPAPAAGQDRPPRPPRVVKDSVRDDRLATVLDSLGISPDSISADSLAAIRDSLSRQEVADRREGLGGGDFPDKDDIFRVLAGLPGYVAVEYRGEIVSVGVPSERLDLLGRAQLNRAGDVLAADTIRYFGDRKFIEARRSIELLGADRRRVSSDSVLYYDLNRLRGTVFEAESEFDDGGTTWRIMGNVIPLAQDTVYATASSFTSCELDVPHYTFRAKQLKMVSRNVLVAWPVVLYVSRVPVFWLPFFAADIRQGRRSGIIPPRFGVNDVVQTGGSTSRQVTDFGYYWAINDYLDAQATVDWFSGNYTRLNGSFRYRFLKQFIQGSVTYAQSFSSTGNNLQLRGSHNHEIGLNTTLRASLDYIQNTRIFQDQSINPRDQTQTVDSDIGLNHRFSFGNLSASGRRRQFLDDGRTETTFPSFSLSASPVTLFAAPQNRAGPFNNLQVSGSGNFSRRAVRADSATDVVTTAASLRSGIRAGRLNISGSASLSDLETTLQDSLFMDLPPEAQTTYKWDAGADFQVNLAGSTVLRPQVRADGALFRSADTGGDFEAAPTRASLGATLSSDLYGFFPGFAGFTRVRHKISPALNWSYSPAVVLDSALSAIPGFPTTAGTARHELSISLNQTFEAKLPAPQADADSANLEAAADSAATEAEPDLFGARPSPARRRREETITLLGIRTSALRFDFERAKIGEPVLVSEAITNSVTSELLRGLSINMTHDLFSGSGSTRDFSPFLQKLTASFSFRGGGSSDVFGVRDRSVPEPRPATTSARDRFRDEEIYGIDDPFGGTGAGPWSLSVTYSLLRVRPEESGTESQSMNATLSLRPTSNWSVRWRTQYNFSEKEFGQNVISLDRDLHRWLASFQFARSPNGNTIFQVSVSLQDAPEIRGEYIQRSD